jgi:phosphohistidine phosphatase SixA
MERRLIILRHASAALDGGGSDHKRPLSSLGREQAERIGERLRELGWQPELVLSSDSIRTRETWQLMAEALAAPDVDVRFLRSLYIDGVSGLRDAGSEMDIKLHTVMVLGHNPGWSQLASIMCGTSVSLSSGHGALLSIDAASWDEALLKDGGWQLEHRVDGDDRSV